MSVGSVGVADPTDAQHVWVMKIGSSDASFISRACLIAPAGVAPMTHVPLHLVPS